MTKYHAPDLVKATWTGAGITVVCKCSLILPALPSSRETLFNHFFKIRTWGQEARTDVHKYNDWRKSPSFLWCYLFSQGPYIPFILSKNNLKVFSCLYFLWCCWEVSLHSHQHFHDFSHLIMWAIYQLKSPYNPSDFFMSLFSTAKQYQC